MAFPTFPRGKPDQRGFALVTALIILMLTSALAVTYFALTTSERAQSSNVQVARASLYAADAGVRAVEQFMANYGKAKLDSIATFYGGSGALLTSPGTFFPSGTWTATTLTSTSPAFTASGTVTWLDSTLTDSAQAYDYRFTITSTGSRGGYGKRVVQSQGILRVSASRGSFADYLIFTNIHTLSNGSAIWFNSNCTFDGRMHTNGEYRFAYKPTFYDLVTSVNSKAWYYNTGSPKELAANKNGTIDVPNFYGGFTRGAGSVTLPTDPYNQQNAALGLDPTSSTAPTTTQIRTQLGITSGTGVPDGVYVPNDGASITGGVYVQGTLTSCYMYATSAGTQVYVMTQGTSVDTIKVNRGSPGTTVFCDQSAGTTTTYAGFCDQIMFVNGKISSLTGPARVSGVVQPALDTDTQMLVATTGDIVVQNDVTCKNFDTAANVLGLYSSGGSVRIGTSAPKDVNIDAFIMATGTSGAFQVDSYDLGTPRGIAHLRGGAVTKYYGAFGQFNSDGTPAHGYGRDFRYDKRGLRPPYYPTSTRLDPDEPTARTLSWKEM